MSFGRFRLMSQLGAGPDGTRYQATDRSDGSMVELLVLSGASADAGRWAKLTTRLRKALLLDHPSCRRIVASDLEGPTPIIALEWVEGRTLAEAGHDPDGAITRAVDLAHGLTAGHRLGIAHGRIGPSTVLARDLGGVALDWTGLDLESPEESDPADSPDAAYRAPEVVRGGAPDAAADVFALGAILDHHFNGPSAVLDAGSTVDRLIREMLDPDPSNRPTARAVAARLASEVLEIRATRVAGSGPVGDSSVTGAFTLADEPEEEASRDREQLGRFRLVARLGQGAMGTVYRGVDLADGSAVAIKVLRPAFARRAESLRRFHKEARLLAEVNNPRVANLIEVNEDDGIHYLALEFVDGVDLAAWTAGRGRLDEPLALAILADVARALEVAHERGIVHRDIKPENILVVDEASGAGQPRVKLSDFGLARHVEESESLILTRAGSIMGTPLYMSPEQCSGEDNISPASDVYSMGATLFALLAGRPPFLGDSPVIVMARHRSEPPPELRSINPTVSDAASSIVAKALSKAPERRYANAGEMLEDLERLIRGEPTGLDVHPRLPDCDPREVTTYDWSWDLESSPQALWPLVSNTERFNRAIGLSAVKFADEADDEAGGSKRSGNFRKSGLEFSWREHPFEWIEGRRMGVVREFSRGPFEWFVSVVELSPRSGEGTTLRHKVQVKPRGLVGRTVAAVEIGTKGRRAIERVYRRIDATLQGKLGRDPSIDPFEAPEPLRADRRRRLERWLDSLGRRGFDSALVERLGDFLGMAPSPEVARIRPLALARRLDVEADALVDACLRGAAEGVLALLWDILCPVCRIPSQVMDTLRALREHGRCEACQLDYELDFANSVELIFRVHPEIREADPATYCAGSPAHSPHVAAQARVGPGERVALDLALEAGSYRLRGPQLPYAIDFRVEHNASARRWDLDLQEGPDAVLPRSLRPGGQVFALANGHDREVLVRVERLAPRDDALTAARASSLALFRELFPGEVLSPGQLINIDTVTLVVTDLDRAGDLYAEMGDSRAFASIHEQFRLIGDRVRREGGAMVKTVLEGTVSAFSDPLAALRVALDLPGVLAGGEATRDLDLRVAVHRGPAMVATLNDHLDYFGTTVGVAFRLTRLARAGQVVLTRPVAADPGADSLLRERGLVPSILEADVEGLADPFVQVVEAAVRG